MESRGTPDTRSGLRGARLITMKKVIILSGVLMIALSVVAFAYAHWTDTIYINGKVEMGSLILGFSNATEPPSCDEYYGYPDWIGMGEYKGKDVAQTNCTYEEQITDVHTGKIAYKKMAINITNAYPSYRVHCTFLVRNIGTIPAIIKGYTITGPGLTAAYNTATGWYDLIDTATGRAVLNVRIVNFINLQLEPHPTPIYEVKSEIDTHVKQDALQCHTYYFEVEIVYEQWGA